MISQLELNIDMQISLGLARSVAPEESGNLKFNAMKVQNTPNGFRINYSSANAFYIYFQELGTRYTTKNMGFIGNKTVPLIAEYHYAKYVTKNKGEVNRYEVESIYGNLDMAEGKGADYLYLRDLRNQQSLSTDLDAMSTDYSWKFNPSYLQPVPQKFMKR